MVGFSYSSARNQKRGTTAADEHVELLKIYYRNDDNANFCSRVSHTSIFIILILATVLVLAPLLINYLASHRCEDFIEDDKQCRIHLVESIPENLTFNGTSPSHVATYDAWMKLLKEAKYSVDIVSYYWTLRDNVSSESSALQGQRIFEELLAVMKRGVSLRIIQSQPNSHYPNYDTELLAVAGAEVLNLDMSHFYGSGVLHTKLWVVDGDKFYLGSANMDWRSLTQVKELGMVVESCRRLVRDVSKLVEVYAFAASKNRLPVVWPCKFRTNFNKDSPHPVKLNGVDSQVYFSSSPPEFCPPGRTSDLDAILDIIHKAKSFVSIAVMDYSPTTLFEAHRKFWPFIDDALRKVAFERKVQVRFLSSLWSSTKLELIPFMKSLAMLNNVTSSVSVKMFCVPSSEKQKLIPYSRVNHNKYMVTDDVAYVGTSNWAGDYFIDTAGVAMVINQTSHPSQRSFHYDLHRTFTRDWSSEHAVDIWDVTTTNFSSICDSH